MQAITVAAKHGPAILERRPRPQVRPGYMLVRTVAVALNPVDAMMSDYGIAEPGYLQGCDYAGIVEEVGAGVRRDFKAGDRVCGCSRSGNADHPGDGTFAEYIVVKADIAVHIPDTMTFEDAATLGVAIVTTGRAMYQQLNIPLPPAKVEGGTQILIYGGSSAMGTMYIQFAKLSGFEVMTTCSTRNFDLLKSYGADHVFDYSEPESEGSIKSLLHGELKYCLDCICTPVTAEFCAKLLSPGATYSIIAGPVESPHADVKTALTMGYSFLGEPWQIMHMKGGADPEAFEAAVRFAELSEGLLGEGKLKTHPTDVRMGGLAAIPTGIDDLRQKKVSGVKIVVPVADT